jgi:hypothetical protein
VSAVSTSSAVSEVSSGGKERDWECDQIAKIRSMDNLGRRFSDVVEVVPRSPDSSLSDSEEEDRDYTPSILHDSNRLVLHTGKACLPPLFRLDR